MDGGEVVTGLPKSILYAGVPEGYDAVVTAEVAAQGEGRDVLFIVRDDKRLAEAVRALNFFCARCSCFAISSLGLFAL